MLTDVPARTDLPTQPTKSFPLVVVDDLDAIRTFYVDTLGCPVTIEQADRYLQVRLTTAPDAPELCFMKPGWGYVDTLGGGFVLSVPVPDADAVQRKLQEAGVTLRGEADDRPWGWRSLQVVDPAGVILDFFHELPRPAEG